MTQEQFWNVKKNLLFPCDRSYRAFELGVRYCNEYKIPALKEDLIDRHKHEVCKELAHQANTLQDKLNKAKEIISKYYNYTSPSSEYFYSDINEEAKQFLEETEK